MIQSKDDILRDRIIELLTYDTQEGIFRWRKIPPSLSKKARREAGSMSNQRRKNPYLSITIDKKSYLAHRLAYLYINGSLPDIVDHINGNTLDNRIVNLRPATFRSNIQNHRLKSRSDKTSGLHRGVYFDNQNTFRKYKAQINADNEKISRYFKTEKEAETWYIAMSYILHDHPTEPSVINNKKAISALSSIAEDEEVVCFIKGKSASTRAGGYYMEKIFTGKRGD
jgi:hypothetical protein